MATEDSINSARKAARNAVQPYRGWRKAWIGRSKGLWGTSAVGVGYGVLIGIAAPMFPALVGAISFTDAMMLIPRSVGVFAATGLLSGFAVGAQVGVSAGAAEGAAQEHESRDREHEVAIMAHIAPDVELPSPAKAEAASKAPKSIWTKVKDTVEDYINPGVALTFALIGAVGGLILAGGYYAIGMENSAAMTGMKALLGPAASNPLAVTAYFTGVCACFGAMFGSGTPKITDHAQHLAGRLLAGKHLSGELFEDKAPAVAQEKTPDTPQPRIPRRDASLPGEIISVHTLEKSALGAGLQK